MEIFSHTFINAHIVGCSPVKKIESAANGTEPFFYEFDLYTTGGLHTFKSEYFKDANKFQTLLSTEEKKKIEHHNIKVNIWKEHADQRINLIESLNPSNYDNI